MILNKNQIASIIYHDKFDYPLTKKELEKWELSLTRSHLARQGETLIEQKNTFFCLKGRSKIIALRQQREICSQQKLIIAQKAGKLLSKIPFIKFVGITGSLAMMNSDNNDDIDLMIITRVNTLWLTRPIVYFLLKIANFNIRKPKEKDEKDKLCLNLWLDETALFWEVQNEFTAHEIAQVIPLINKDKMYERFLWTNRWILHFWPNSVVVKKISLSASHLALSSVIGIINYLSYICQLLYMRGKITNERVELNRAIFHPKSLL